MANEEHLAFAQAGCGRLERVRKENPDTRPDLRKADLSGEDLREANLSDD
jgi:uncharacterized protein YjbI with pentapeptide repeats